MLIRHPPDLPGSEITPQGLYLRRRQFLHQAGALGGAALLGGLAGPARAQAGFGPLVKSPTSTDEKPNTRQDITTYNNFYEFGPNKDDPARVASRMKTRPWTVQVEGLVKKPLTLGLEEILKLAPLEERIYRLRCVEAWSMVVPWVGFPLKRLIDACAPLGSAKFVEFQTLADPEVMPLVRLPLLDWPYTEGLRMDEALHPLTIVAVGLYGEVLPHQNGAPLRLVVPWKYGFKSAKSIVRIRFAEQSVTTTWMKAGPGEYGYFANVNPEVEHPRWSQARERRLGEFLKRKTLPFNGYADQVAGLYTGLDLRRWF